MAIGSVDDMHPGHLNAVYLISEKNDSRTIPHHLRSISKTKPDKKNFTFFWFFGKLKLWESFAMTDRYRVCRSKGTLDHRFFPLRSNHTATFVNDAISVAQ